MFDPIKYTAADLNGTGYLMLDEDTQALLRQQAADQGRRMRTGFDPLTGERVTEIIEA